MKGNSDYVMLFEEKKITKEKDFEGLRLKEKRRFQKRRGPHRGILHSQRNPP